MGVKGEIPVGRNMLGHPHSYIGEPMTQPTVAELASTIGQRAKWRLHHGGTDLLLSIKIINAKTAYGSIRYLCEIEDQTIWLDETSVKLTSGPVGFCGGDHGNNASS